MISIYSETLIFSLFFGVKLSWRPTLQLVLAFNVGTQV